MEHYETQINKFIIYLIVWVLLVFVCYIFERGLTIRLAPNTKICLPL